MVNIGRAAAVALRRSDFLLACVVAYLCRDRDEGLVFARRAGGIS
jgi:hypothetical protein